MPVAVVSGISVICMRRFLYLTVYYFPTLLYRRTKRKLGRERGFKTHVLNALSKQDIQDKKRHFETNIVRACFGEKQKNKKTPAAKLHVLTRFSVS